MPSLLYNTNCIKCTYYTIGWMTSSDLQLSPKKALRAAMLKSRFADTILKAKQKTLLDHVIQLSVLDIYLACMFRLLILN